MPVSPRPTIYPLKAGGLISSSECSNCKVMQRVKLQLEQSEVREKDLRDKLREARSELSSRERQLEVSKRMLARVSTEKAQLEAAAESDKVATRKLEQRLTAVEGGEGAAAKASRTKAQLLQLREQVAEQEAALILAEEAKQNAAREIHVLKSALGLKNELPDGVLESHGKLLHALAKSQEESSALALALGDKETALAEGEAALRSAQAEVERLLAARLQLVGEVEEARRETGDALSLAGDCRKDALACRSEVAGLVQRLQEEEDHRLGLESQLRAAEAGLDAQREQSHALSNQLADAQRSARLTVEALKCEVSQAVQQAEAQAAEHKAEAAARAAALGEQLVELRQQLDRQTVLHEAQLLEAHQQAEDTRSLLQSVRQELDQARADHRRALAAADSEQMVLKGRIESLTQLNNRLQDEVNAAERVATTASAEADVASAALREERREAGGLRSAVEALEDKLHHSLALSHDREQALEERVSQLSCKLSQATHEIAHLQQQLECARDQVAAAITRTATADEQVEAMHTTIESLTTSKERLQSGLLEQLSAFRSKLTEAEEENKQLRLALQDARHVQGAMSALIQKPPASPAVDPRVHSNHCRVQEMLAAARSAKHPPVNSLRNHASHAHASSITLGQEGPGTTPSIYNRARAQSRALGCEDSDSDNDVRPRNRDGLIKAGVDSVLSGRANAAGRISKAALTSVQSAMKQAHAR